MIKLSQTHSSFFNYLLSDSITSSEGTSYFDFKVGSSLVFLFPYYIQVGLSQIFNILEQNIIDEFELAPLTAPSSHLSLSLSYSLLEKQLPSYTSSFIDSNFDTTVYNNTFGLQVKSQVFTRELELIIAPTVGVLGNSSLFSQQPIYTPRDRLDMFFEQTNFQMDGLEDYINITITNNRILATKIFCTYFKYPNQLTQEMLTRVETWLLERTI